MQSVVSKEILEFISAIVIKFELVLHKLLHLSISINKAFFDFTYIAMQLNVVTLFRIGKCCVLS